MPCRVSLEAAILEHCGSAADHSPGMGLDQLLARLRAIEDFDLAPATVILRGSESLAQPAHVGAANGAVLEWVNRSFTLWQQNYPLAEEMAVELRQLLPVASAMALVDPHFMLPGAHPMHMLLDDIHTAAIGWQPRLGRAGETLARQVRATIIACQGWFEDRELDLGAISRDFKLGAEREQARAARMKQRMVEAEQGRLKTTAARADASRMINAALARFELPSDIGEFIKGAWFDSTQLILLKFGADSEQWRQITQTTEILMDSMQDEGPQGEHRRQYLFELVTRLPRELRRWLVSLQHDSDAVAEAVGRVEIAHLQLLRQQPLQRTRIAPLRLPDIADVQPGRASVGQLHTGQWFRLQQHHGDYIRVQLALKLEQEHQLLFTNQAGVKVMLVSNAEFADLVAQHRATELHAGCSFSLSLAEAAGVTTTADVDALLAASSEAERRETEQALRDQELREQLQREQEDLERQQQERGQPQQVETRTADPAEPAAEASRPESSSEPDQKPEPGLILELELDSEVEFELKPAPEFELQLPMGTWLGFHDGKTPIMARLAVHDREQNIYIFVNRAGIKLRQLKRSELMSLIEQDLVDILETRSTFKEAITQVKKNDQE